MEAFLFPGQGSQHRGMGEALFDEFKDLTRRADEILGYSIRELCLQDSQQRLDKTQYTQPALYVVNAFTYFKALEKTGTVPDYVAGHSLGEYNALLAAGAFDFETGLKLVQKRAELMGQAMGGGMAAVIGLSAERVSEVLVQYGLTDIDIANYNAPAQIVIAGQKSDIEKAEAIFETAGARLYMHLRVSGAFHSRAMINAQKEFENFLQRFHFSNLFLPVISNVRALPYQQGEIKEGLAQQITHPVRWMDSMYYLMEEGEVQIKEIGPGNVLMKLLHQIRKEFIPTGTRVVQKSVESNGNLRETVPGAVLTIEPRPSPLPTRPSEKDGHTHGDSSITGLTLGDSQFKKDYGLTYAYITGAMYRGIASEEVVIKAGRAGLLGFYGIGGLGLGRIEEAIRTIQRALNPGEAYGMNFLHSPADPIMEERIVNLYLKYGIRNIEASAFMNIVPALIIYRAKGLKRATDGKIVLANRIIAKLSRPEVAKAFLSPAPEYLVEKLLREQKITREEAALLGKVPMADDLTVEADSGGHTDQGVAYALMPALLSLRDEMMKKYGYPKKIRVGAAGGIGTPAAAAAAFMLGADFIVTGSINQCTVEAGTSEAVKNLLQQANVQDTDYAPAGDMFEFGAKVQVLKKGLFFPARANKLYELYRQYNSLEEIDEKTRNSIQEKYFHRSFAEIYQELRASRPAHEVEKAERNPKYKMALIFAWYFGYTTHLALSGNQQYKVDYQIHCGPALGSFNQWVKGTKLEDWRNRHVDEIGVKLMNETAELLNDRFTLFRNLKGDIS
jgi:trans-AT polyketide synthase/acyltransferase/oxidoreductase domain-containing protein